MFNQDNDKTVSVEITQQLQGDVKDVFTVISCLWNIFTAGKTRQQTIPGTLRCVAYALQKPLKRFRKMPTTRHHNTTRHG